MILLLQLDSITMNTYLLFGSTPELHTLSETHNVADSHRPWLKYEVVVSNRLNAVFESSASEAIILDLREVISFCRIVRASCRMNTTPIGTSNFGL
jgi:hypothetical protein